MLANTGESTEVLEVCFVFPRYHSIASIIHLLSISINCLHVKLTTQLPFVPAPVQPSSLNGGVIELFRFYKKQRNYITKNLEKLVGYSSRGLVCNMLLQNLVARNDNCFVISCGFCAFRIGEGLSWLVLAQDVSCGGS